MGSRPGENKGVTIDRATAICRACRPQPIHTMEDLQQADDIPSIIAICDSCIISHLVTL